MIDPIVIQKRIMAAEGYLQCLDSSLESDWLPQYDSFLARNRPLNLGLALIHAGHYEEYADRFEIQGRRAFDIEVAQATARCNAALIWGVNCSNSIDGTLCGDHLFPYALGGPTLASNKMLLCSRHNRMKSVDIHMYPWELGEPKWLMGLLQQIDIVMKRQ